MGKKKGGGMVRIKQTGPSKAQRDMMKQMASGTNPMEEFMIPPEDMVHLPPTPDRNFQMFWPIHESFTMDPSDFFVIYPSYLDSSKTIKQGRRIGAEKAVDTPTVQDLSDALASLTIRHVQQPHKGYSRDPTTLWDNPGRVRVDPAALESGAFDTKRSLMVELASIIEELPSRARRLQILAEVEKARKAKLLEAKEKKKKEQQAKQQQQQRSQTASRSTNKKKGKKKR